MPFQRNCILFVAEEPLPRYVGTANSVTIVTLLIQQLVAFLAANNATELEQPVSCHNCLKRIKDNNDPVRYSLTQLVAKVVDLKVVACTPLK